MSLCILNSYDSDIMSRFSSGVNNVFVAKILIIVFIKLKLCNMYMYNKTIADIIDTPAPLKTWYSDYIRSRKCVLTTIRQRSLNSCFYKSVTSIVETLF